MSLMIKCAMSATESAAMENLPLSSAPISLVFCTTVSNAGQLYTQDLVVSFTSHWSKKEVIGRASLQ